MLVAFFVTDFLLQLLIEANEVVFNPLKRLMMLVDVVIEVIKFINELQRLLLLLGKVMSQIEFKESAHIEGSLTGLSIHRRVTLHQHGVPFLGHDLLTGHGPGPQ